MREANGPAIKGQGGRGCLGEIYRVNIFQKLKYEEAGPIQLMFLRYLDTL